MKNNDARLNSSDTVGAYLREKRLSHNIGLEEISEATGISTGVLQALENEDREQLPAEVYIKAFYKKYAEFLGLDPEEVQEKYQHGAHNSKNSGRKFNSSTVVTLKRQEVNLLAETSRRLLLPLAILIIGIFLYWIYKNYLAPHNPLGFHQEHLPLFCWHFPPNSFHFFC